MQAVDGPSTALVVGLELALTVSAGIIARPTASRATIALALATLALGLPFVLPLESIGARGLLGFHASVAMLRVIDLARDRRRWSVPRRVWLLAVLVDVREAKPTSDRRSSPGEVAALAGLAALSTIAFVAAADVAPTLAGGPARALRWFGGLVGFYCAFDLTMRITTLAHRLAGYQLPPLHRDPILSRTVSEFWAKRWNLTVSDWLRRNCMRPLARRRRPKAAIIAAFTASAALHFWQAFVCLPWAISLLAPAYFLIQGLVVVVERALGVGSWPTAPARVWTILLVAGPSPMLIELLMRVIDGIRA